MTDETPLIRQISGNFEKIQAGKGEWLHSTPKPVIYWGFEGGRDYIGVTDGQTGVIPSQVFVSFAFTPTRTKKLLPRRKNQEREQR
jgi:hypothetical protein